MLHLVQNVRWRMHRLVLLHVAVSLYDIFDSSEKLRYPATSNGY